jgi:hypothetical protein
MTVIQVRRAQTGTRRCGKRRNIHYDIPRDWTLPSRPLTELTWSPHPTSPFVFRPAFHRLGRSVISHSVLGVPFEMPLSTGCDCSPTDELLGLTVEILHLHSGAAGPPGVAVCSYLCEMMLQSLTINDAEISLNSTFLYYSPDGYQPGR